MLTRGADPLSSNSHATGKESYSTQSDLEMTRVPYASTTINVQEQSYQSDVASKLEFGSQERILPVPTKGIHVRSDVDVIGN